MYPAPKALTEDARGIVILNKESGPMARFPVCFAMS